MPDRFKVIALSLDNFKVQEITCKQGQLFCNVEIFVTIHYTLFKLCEFQTRIKETNSIIFGIVSSLLLYTQIKHHSVNSLRPSDAYMRR